MRTWLVTGLVLILAGSCSDEKVTDLLPGLRFPPNGTHIYFFLLPECPMSAVYAPEIKAIQSEFEKKGIGFTAIFPSAFSNAALVDSFLQTSGLTFSSIHIDSLNIAAGFFDCHVAPSVYLADEDGNILYKGRIDDRAYDTGKTRLEANVHDLRNALNERIVGKAISVKETRAVGCFIE